MTTTTDPFAAIPNASDDAYAGTTLETPQERERRVTIAASYCERCGGETGWGCLGGSDCDDNLDLLRDGVSPGYFRNPAKEG